jgi:hypothetical protein
LERFKWIGQTKIWINTRHKIANLPSWLFSMKIKSQICVRIIWSCKPSWHTRRRGPIITNHNSRTSKKRKEWKNSKEICKRKLNRKSLRKWMHRIVVLGTRRMILMMLRSGRRTQWTRICWSRNLRNKLKLWRRSMIIRRQSWPNN